MQDPPVARVMEAAEMAPRAGTGITWPWQVWYLTARPALLRWKSPPRIQTSSRQAFPRATEEQNESF